MCGVIFYAILQYSVFDIEQLFVVIDRAELTSKFLEQSKQLWTSKSIQQRFISRHEVSGRWIVY